MILKRSYSSLIFSKILVKSCKHKVKLQKCLNSWKMVRKSWKANFSFIYIINYPKTQILKRNQSMVIKILMSASSRMPKRSQLAMVVRKKLNFCSIKIYAKWALLHSNGMSSQTFHFFPLHIFIRNSALFSFFQGRKTFSKLNFFFWLSTLVSGFKTRKD